MSNLSRSLKPKSRPSSSRAQLANKGKPFVGLTQIDTLNFQCRSVNTQFAGERVLCDKPLPPRKSFPKSAQRLMQSLSIALRQMTGFMNCYRERDKKTLLEDLRSRLEPSSWECLKVECDKVGGAWSGQSFLAWLRAYIDFASHHSLGSKEGKLPLEVQQSFLGVAGSVTAI